jgi:hypothetical protein
LISDHHLKIEYDLAQKGWGSKTPTILMLIQSRNGKYFSVEENILTTGTIVLHYL